MKWKSCIIVLLLICLVNIVGAQTAFTPDTINIDKIQLAKRLPEASFIYIDKTRKLSLSQLPAVQFTDTLPRTFKVSSNIVESDVYLKFTVSNQSDSSIVFHFFPGIYFKKIEVYCLNEAVNRLEACKVSPDSLYGFKKLGLEAHQTATYIAKLQFIKANTHAFTPVLIKDYYRRSYIVNYQNGDKSSNVITFVFSGILLMMIFYSLAVYFMNWNIEFIYYAAYAFCLGLMLFLKAYYYRTPSPFMNFFEAYLDFVLQSAGTFIYLAFLRKFIESKKYFPWLHKMMIYEQCIIVGSIGLFSYLHFETNKFGLQDTVEAFSKLVWVTGAVIFVIYTLNKKNKFLYYLAVGHSFLIIGGLISLYLIKYPVSAAFSSRYPGPAGKAITYYEIGLAIELMFFLTALAMKNKNDLVSRTKERERLKLKTEMQDFEKQLAVLSAQQDERNRISADMHDELGSGVTHIRPMSEIVKSKLKDNVFPEIDKISNSANELIIKMNTLIWTMKSDNDSVESLITYIRIYSLEFFENTSISCDVRIPTRIPNIELTGVKRRNIFLSVKETLNNALKHSKADKIIISFEVNTKLTIIISDNGVGIDFNKLRRFGSGLTNIRKRVEGIEGTYDLDNNPTGGARTTLVLDL